MNFQSRFLSGGSDWLKQFKQRFGKKSKRQPPKKATPCALEDLEQRTLLSATGALLGTELLIVTDANESVSIAQDLANPTFVEVLINNATISSLPPINLNDIQSLVIQTGELDNSIDLSQINATAFMNLTSIRVESGDGDDTILLTPDFPTTVFAGDGNDTITGSDAADSINGEDGNDSIIGGLGNDTIDAGNGDDFVSGDGGRDEIQAGDGDDTVNGGDDADTIMGDDGTDDLSGDAGNDSIIGDAGDDIITGGDDNDIVFGGGGSDSISGGDGVDLLNGSSGADVIDGGLGADVLFGKGGRDTIFGGDANDFIKAGSGNDSVAGNAQNDTIFGGTGNDQLFGDSDDTLSTELGNDQLFGEAGRDTLIGSRGSDQLNGGDGNDLLRSAPVLGTEPAILPVPPTPLIPTLPPGPPTTNASGILDNAFSMGTGLTVGSQNTMSTGFGDGNLSLTVDALGAFGTNSATFSGATFDPFGAPTANSTTFDSSVYIRTGNMGPRTRLDAAATIVSPIIGNSTESVSTFNVGALVIRLTQTVEPIIDNAVGQTGALLTQTYRITNFGADADVELVRYYDGDLQFDSSGLTDGSGHLVATSGEDIAFITDQAGNAGTPTNFVGVTADQGFSFFFGPAPFQSDVGGTLEAAIQAGTPLSNTVLNDVDGDEFTDAGLDFDASVAIAGTQQIRGFRTRTFTTHTIFGSGSPALAISNTPPAATDDVIMLPTGADGGSITFDVTANDSDVDGVLDLSTVLIATPPNNGTAVSLGNGLVEYTSNPGFVGVDFFQYSIQDNQGALSMATVRVAVLDTDSSADTFSGGAGVDTIIGANGDDFVDGGNDGDLVDGGGGNDFIYGGGGNDSLQGGDGRDTLIGNGGTDTLNGGESDDTIIWRGQKDFKVNVESSAGQDFLVIQGDSTGNILTVQTVGNDLQATEGNAKITIDAAIQNITVNLGGGDDSLTMLDMSGAQLNAIQINGESGNDTINLAAANRVGTLLIRADGGDGNDMLTGSDFSESLIGGAGDDMVVAGAGDDLLEGGDGNDVLNGGLGNDSSAGGAGNDELIGGDGNDSLIGDSGDDIVNGDAGNDVLQGNFGNDFLNGSTGNDSISGGLGADAVVGGAGKDTLDGGHNDDIIVGNSGNDLIFASNGNDLVNGGNGNDTLNGGDGDDTLQGGNGNDLLGGFDGADFMSGDAGSDTLVGGDGDDILLGGSENDTLLGEEGGDAINGGGGSDTASQGDGVDVALQKVETPDEAFVLADELLSALNGSV